MWVSWHYSLESQWKRKNEKVILLLQLNLSTRLTAKMRLAVSSRKLTYGRIYGIRKSWMFYIGSTKLIMLRKSLVLRRTFLDFQLDLVHQRKETAKNFFITEFFSSLYQSHLHVTCICLHPGVHWSIHLQPLMIIGGTIENNRL